jgi:hypothetical protein
MLTGIVALHVVQLYAADVYESTKKKGKTNFDSLHYQRKISLIQPVVDVSAVVLGAASNLASARVCRRHRAVKKTGDFHQPSVESGRRRLAKSP